MKIEISGSLKEDLERESMQRGSSTKEFLTNAIELYITLSKLSDKDSKLTIRSKKNMVEVKSLLPERQIYDYQEAKRRKNRQRDISLTSAENS